MYEPDKFTWVVLGESTPQVILTSMCIIALIVGLSNSETVSQTARNLNVIGVRRVFTHGPLTKPWNKRIESSLPSSKCGALMSSTHHRACSSNHLSVWYNSVDLYEWQGFSFGSVFGHIDGTTIGGESTVCRHKIMFFNAPEIEQITKILS